ncbi:NEP1-interacting protein 1 isoform X2 [Euphorbia lathyris]|uniref:NEP1-interacting protein 1 isoform X2 n=1 Tax=Euphorbia lathyris TaxID=212925 RepID=UPI0033130F89
MHTFPTAYFLKLIKRILYAAFTCILALGGAVVGIIIGAMKGQTTETGFLRGSGIGAVAGAITAIQLMDSISHDEHFSKISTLESTYREISDIYDTNGNRGLSNNFILNLPQFTFQSINNLHLQFHESCCSICLEDFKDGELMRKLSYCGHLFHLECLDKWLYINGCCPICRNNICDEPFVF